MKKVAICYFSYHEDVDFLNESLKLLQKTIEHQKEYDVKVYVFDDGTCEKRINKSNLETSCSLITTKFNRNGNLNGFECINGMFREYVKLSQEFDYDYLIKLDSDCVLNSLDYLKTVEDKLESMGDGLVDKLGQIGSFFAQICCYGCCQTFTKLGVGVIFNLCQHMLNPANNEAKVMRKRVENGWNEDKVVSVLMEMCTVIRVSLEQCQIKGHLNAFEHPNEDYSEWVSVAFKPNRYGSKGWSREKSLEKMKRFVA